VLYMRMPAVRRRKRRRPNAGNAAWQFSGCQLASACRI